MERENIVVLASLVAALALLGLRLFAPDVVPDLTVASADAGRFAFGPDGVRDRKLPPSHIAMYAGGRNAEKPPRGVPPPPGEERRGSRGGSVAGAAAAEVIPATARGYGALEQERRHRFDAFDPPEGELSSSLFGGRTAAVSPPAHASSASLPEANPNKLNTFEFVDNAPKNAGGADVLLSIPFNGDLKAVVGGGPIQATGLVSTGNQVEFPDDAQLSFPVGNNVNSKAGTISFEVQPQWAGSDQTDNSLVQIRDEHIWENTLEIVKNFSSLRYIIIDSGGVESNVNIPIDDWSAGEQHHLAATWDESSMALYVNGQMVGENALAHPLDFSPTTPIHIGSDFPDASYAGAGGTISDFTVYGRALGADEIASR